MPRRIKFGCLKRGGASTLIWLLTNSKHAILCVEAFFVVLLKTEVKRTENGRNLFPNFRHFCVHTSFICPVPCFLMKCFTIFLKANSSSGSLTSLKPESILAKLRYHQVVRVTVRDWWKVQGVGAFGNVVADPLLLFSTKLSDPSKWRLHDEPSIKKVIFSCVIQHISNNVFFLYSCYFKWPLSRCTSIWQ